MIGKNKFVIEERPETQVYTTDNGFIGIRQTVRGEETVILLTPDEAGRVIEYIHKCIEKLKQ